MGEHRMARSATVEAAASTEGGASCYGIRRRDLGAAECSVSMCSLLLCHEVLGNILSSIDFSGALVSGSCTVQE
ncbi:hypothetical protein PIB30_013817 [Stylosanthes scabra]|uniref:Uncharacterized protein n=1 Tax=Stylosanthes scabra TaxID=79078 RepID=A0ABU6S6U4_9FABA|nr:hypothetical protein [Stylosanthes scabra]